MRWIAAAFGVMAATLAVSLFVPAAAAAAGAPVTVGRAPALPAGAHLKAALPASTPIHLSIGLRSQDPAGLQAFATSVSTPGSPQFRHYLSVPEFADRFGATDAAIAAVQSELRSEGLQVQAPMANHLTLDASGTTATVQRAFGTKLSSVKLASGRVAYANTKPAVLPQAVAAHVEAVIGLNNLVTEQPQGRAPVAPPAPVAPLQAAQRSQTAQRSQAAHAAAAGPQPCAAARTDASQGGYTADTIASAYGFSSLFGAGDLGAGQTVALYELQPYNSTDISTYASCYGITPSITNVSVDGASPTANSGDDSEAALDIEQVIGLAPAAKIIVYDAPNPPNGGPGPIDEYAQIISDDKAQVISSSWGGCEATTGAAALQDENTLFQEAAAQGQSIFVASGDSGSTTCYDPTVMTPMTKPTVSDPASQPFATGVGGTLLYTTGPALWAPGAPLDQSVWNDGTNNPNTNPTPDPSGGGGGISGFWAMPSYQSSAASSVGVINASSSGAPCGQASGDCREVPDVSASGDPIGGYAVHVSTTAGSGECTGTATTCWTLVGGTSAAAPLWAAFTALVNADTICKAQPVGFINPTLYRLAGSNYAGNFYDVTLPDPFTGSANNDALGVNAGAYPVTPGYDMATGLGTPIAPQLASSLCGGLNTVTVTNPGTQSGTVGTAQTLQIQSSDSGGVPVTYTVTGLPAGMSINSATGLISGTPSTAGTSTVTVTATDSSGSTGSTQFNWTIAPAPTTTTTTTTTTTATATTATAPTVTVAFYRCTRTCKLLSTHGATSYKTTAADWGTYLKIVTTTTVAGSPPTVAVRWTGPITGKTAGFVTLGTGARTASSQTMKGTTHTALATDRVTKATTKKGKTTLMLAVTRRGKKTTKTWAFIVKRGGVVSCTTSYSAKPTAKMKLTLTKGESVKLVAVQT